MSRTWLSAKRMLVLVTMGGSTFALLGGVFSPESPGCNYATFANYTTLLTSSGNAVIKTVSDNVFGKIGKDYDTIVRAPTTAFAQSVWGNWVSAHIPADLTNNTIVLR